MDKTCKYYKYQKYVSYDNGATWQPLNQFQRGELMEFNSPDCGASVEALYKWEVVSGEYDCDGFDKYQKTQKYVSYDNGVTYNPVSPAEYGLGNLLEHNSVDCGYVIYDKYRWVDTGEIVCIEEEECEDVDALNNVSPEFTAIRDEEYWATGDCCTISDVKGEDYADPTALSPVKKLIINTGCYVIDKYGNPPMRTMPNLTALTITNNSTVYPPYYDVNNIFISRVGCSIQDVGGLGRHAFVYSDDITSLNYSSSSGYINVYVPQSKLVDYRSEFGFDEYHGSRVGHPYILPFNDATYVIKNIDKINYDYQVRWIDSGTTCVGVDKHRLLGKQTRNSYLQNWTDAGETMVGDLLEYASYDCGYVPSVYKLSMLSNSGETYYLECNSSTTLTHNEVIEAFGVRQIDSVIIGDCVNVVDNNAFYEEFSLKSLEIRSGVTTIGTEAFCKCYSLSSLTLPNSVTSIGNGAFYGCSALTSVNLSNSITSIPAHAFTNCSSILDIDIPSGVTRIGQESFYCCKSLSGINLSNTSMVGIDNGAFAYCGITNLNTNHKISYIGLSAFRNCSGLTSVTIDSTVESIGYGVFEDCINLTNVTIPNNLTSVSASLFKNCGSLTSLTIPSGVTSIGSEAFANCTSLTSVTIEAVTPPELGNDAFYHTNGCIIYVPCESVNTYKSNWTYVASRIYGIPPCGEPIPKSLVANFSNGTVIEKTCEYSAISSNFFTSSSPSSALTSVTIGSCAKGIRDGAFKNCTNLTNITINSGLQYINASAFTNCYSLTSIVIPNTVSGGSTSASQPYVFYNCTSLSSVTLSSSMTKIPSNWFDGCVSLRNITIPSGVTSIEGSAFANCSGLTSITIPASVTFIGRSSFSSASSLTSITCLATEPPFMQEYAFDLNGNFIIYVPAESVDLYKSEYGWTYFADKIQSIS